MIPYIEQFLTKAAADSLFTSVQSLPAVRAKNPRGNSYIRKVSYGAWSVLPKKHGGETEPIGDAPSYIKELAGLLSNYAGKEINYLVALGYENEKDHIGWHNHREDLVREDQSVWVVSLGQIRELALRPKGSKDKSTWEYLYPEHGSLYVLPSEYNTTHEHAILNQAFPCSLRISINCKHMEAEYIKSQLAKPKTGPHSEKKGLIVATNGVQSIYCCRKHCEYPPEAVYVGRKYGDRPDTPFGNRKKLKGDAWKAEVAGLMESPEFRAQVEALRGKDLLCWCLPKEADHCHARAWLELANGTTTHIPDPPFSEPPNRKKSRVSPSTKAPTFAYPGGKARLAKRIAAMLPQGRRFIEPFAGRGNVYFYLATYQMYSSYWLNDLQTAPFLSILRLGHILAVPKPGEESLEKYRARWYDTTKSPFTRKHALMLEPYLCWNGGIYGQSGGTRRGTQSGYTEKIRVASEILRATNTKITRLDYRDVLAQCGEGDVVYLDPPYIDANVKAYSDKTLNHQEMVRILETAKFKWLLSEYQQPLYIEAFGSPAVRIPVRRGMGKPGGGSKAQKDTVECFWTNFTLAKPEQSRPQPELDKALCEDAQVEEAA